MYLADGTFELSVPPNCELGVPPLQSALDAITSEEYKVAKKKRQEATFWTLPWSYWRLPAQEGLMTEFAKSSLVIFKGDLKLVCNLAELDGTSTDGLNPFLLVLVTASA
jgi:hypothetical protein